MVVIKTRDRRVKEKRCKEEDAKAGCTSLPAKPVVQQARRGKKTPQQKQQREERKKKRSSETSSRRENGVRSKLAQRRRVEVHLPLPRALRES